MQQANKNWEYKTASCFSRSTADRICKKHTKFIRKYRKDPVQNKTSDHVFSYTLYLRCLKHRYRKILQKR